MASYVENMLMPNERVVGVAFLHWMVYVRGMIITACGGLLGTFSYPIIEYLFGTKAADDFAHPLTAVGAVIILIGTSLLIGAYTRQVSTQYVITTNRLIAKYGVVARATYEIMASRITGANFTQTVAGRLFGFGTIWVHGAGGEASPIYRVANPRAFYRAMMTVLDRFQSPQSPPSP